MLYSQYTFINKLKLIKSYIFTRIFYSKARLIRLPFDIRNKKYINLGLRLTTGVSCRLEAYCLNNTKTVLNIGNNVQINDFVHIAAMENVYIGNNVLIASRVFISDISHGSYNGNFQDDPVLEPSKRSLSSKPVIIEDNVWIGESVNIMPGVHIGKGCIIGAGSVVTKSIPSNSIAVGIPAKIIKQFDSKSKKWIKHCISNENHS